MSTKVNELINELYSDIGFIFGTIDDFKKILNENVNSIESSEKNINEINIIISEQIKAGKINILFKNYLTKENIKEAFNFFNYIIENNDIQLSEDDYVNLLNIDKIVEYFNSLEKDHIDTDKQTLEGNLFETYSFTNSFNDKESTFGTSRFSDDIVTDYLSYIGAISLLTPDEEKNMFQKLDELQKNVEENKNEIKELKENIVSHNLRLVIPIAIYYEKFGNTLTLMDLIQEGNIGLMKAVDRFDVSRGFKFSTYATPWIRQGITRALGDKSRTIRIPVHQYDLQVAFNAFVTDYTNDNGVAPSDDIIMKKLNITKEMLGLIRNCPAVVASLDQPVNNEDEDSYLGDFIENNLVESAENIMEQNDLKNRINAMLEFIGQIKPDDNETTIMHKKRKVYIMKQRFGLNDGKSHTLDEIAKDLGITRERVRQIESKTIREISIKDPTKERQNIRLYYGEKNTSNTILNEYIEYCKKNDIKLRIKDYGFLSNAVTITCDVCGYTWSTYISSLNKSTHCELCEKRKEIFLEKMKQKAKEKAEVPKEIEDVKPSYQYKPRCDSLEEYIGITKDELEYALNRLIKSDSEFVLNRFNTRKSKAELTRYNNLVDHIRKIVEKARKRQEFNRTRKNKKN